MNLVSTGAFLGVLFLTPLFLQEVHGVSPVTSGLTTFSEAIGVALGATFLGACTRAWGRGSW